MNSRWALHPNPEKSLEKMTELGYDYNSFYDEEGSEIPVPAVFVLEQNGTVSFAQSEGGDYRNRVEPSSLLAIPLQVLRFTQVRAQVG